MNRVNKCYCRHIRGSTILLLFFLIVICNVFSACSAYATDSITLNIDTNNLAVNLMSLSSSGDFAKSNNMNISVSTTSSGGYTLGIASSTGSTDLTNQSDSTKKINSITSAISESTFSTSSTYNNKWGYKPSHLYNSSTEITSANTNFRPLPDDSGEIIAKTKCANGTSPCTNTTDSYNISIGTRVNNQTKIGSYVSDTFIITAVTNKSVIPCDSSKLCVAYDGNGLSFPETSSQLPRSVNNVNYNSTTTSQTITKILHSDNVGDDGIATGNSAVNTNQTKEATIDGVSNVSVSLYYDTEGVSYDWVALYAGANSVPSSANDGNKGSNGNLTGKLGGNKSGYTTSYTTWNLWNNDGNPIDTDTIKIHFRTDGTAGSYISYGYYAIITGTSTTYERSVSSGEYATPTGTNPVFHGWSTSQTTPGGGLPSDVEYTNESEVLAKMPGDEGETKTLYAVWQQSYPITFTMDSNVTKIDVLDASGATVGTITGSGQSLALTQGDTYTIKPTHAMGYTTNPITKTSGTGTLNGKQFTVGAGSTTLSVTSKLLSPMQNWTDCSSLAQGDTEEVYDTRDNEVYLIGKLADGKCWMLDNLRLDLTSSTVLNNTTASNTHASATTLNYLKNGGGTTSDQYATAGVANWTSSYSYPAPLVNATYKDNTTTSYGDGSGKIGVYYNYCAASAGSYCYGNGASAGTSSGNATEDICPAGWRMPTGSSSGEYQALYTAYNSDYTSLKNALSTPFSGVFNNGSASSLGSNGFFWSSTRNASEAMYGLYVNSSNFYPADYNYRLNGYPVRCILGT